MELKPSLFQGIVQRTSVPVVVLDDKLRVVLFNSGMEKLTGYSATEVKGKSYLQRFIPIEQKSDLMEVFEKILSGEVVPHTNPILTREHARKHIRWEGMPLREEGLTLIVEIGKDLTEQVLVQQKLNASEKVLSSLVESIPNMVYRCYPDPNQTFIFAKWAEKITGYSAEELTQKAMPSHIALIHPDDIQRVKSKMESSIADGSSYWVEYRLINKDGSSRQVLDTGTGVRDDSGSLIEINGVIMDRTEHTKLENRYRYLVHVVMDSPNPIFGLDDKMRIKVWNGAATDVLGYQEPMVRGKHISTLFSDQEAQKVQAAIDKVKELGSIEPFEATFIDANGREKELMLSAGAIKDDEGGLMGIGIVGRDTTPQKMLEHEKGELERQLLQVAMLPTTTELASDIAHELNNPISTIMEHALLLKEDTPKDSKQGVLIEDILSETTSISSIVKRLVEFSQEQYEPFESVCLDEVINGALKLIEQQLKSCSLHVNTKFQEGLPPVYANKNQLQQMLVQLLLAFTEMLDASHESTPDNLIEITIKTTNEGEYVVLHIEDEKIGILLKELEKVFAPHLSRKITESTDGGHSVSYEGFTNNSGYLKVESKEGEYTRVKLMLPARTQFRIQKVSESV
ncbi:MAG: PAS domain S-box protein [Methermicoccaceae archaeon]